MRTERDSDSKYSNPEFTMVFPGGNYSLTGDRAFNIPVPIVGIDDLGYATMLQLFCGARQLGVARVPDFIHMRQNRSNGGSAHGSLSQFCAGEKDMEFLQFQNMACDYAAKVAQVPQENIDGLMRVQSAKRRSQLRVQREIVQTTAELARDDRFKQHASMLKDLKRSVHSFAVAKCRATETPLDSNFVQSLIDSMVRLHPQLIEKAYQFGADGELAEYKSATQRKNISRIVAGATEFTSYSQNPL